MTERRELIREWEKPRPDLEDTASKRGTMSVITDVLVSTPLEEDDDTRPIMRLVTAGPPDEVASGTFVCSTEEKWGGSKAPCFELYAGTFNYLNETKLLDWLRSIPWDEPDRVQVFLLGEDDDRFRVTNLSEPSHGAWTIHD